MQHLNEALARRGLFQSLRELEGSSKTLYPRSELQALLEVHGVDEPKGAIEDLAAEGLLHRVGNDYYLSTRGTRASLLLQALNGADLAETFDKLAAIDPMLARYELVREGITEIFIQSLVDRPGFSRLYFCSPWIHLSAKEGELLLKAVRRARQQYANPVEVFLLTRPQDEDGAIPGGAKIFRELSAEIYLHPRLHTKLYIREPDVNGAGVVMGIVSSENLTRSRYLELGIKITSDGRMINQLVRYFFELSQQSREA